MSDAFLHTDEAQTARNASDEADRFSYTYSAKQKQEIESIRRKYLSREENKLEQLHRLDKQAERPGTIVSISLIGALFSIFLQISTVASSTARPATPQTTPCVAMPHSGSRHMHMPSAKNTPPTVPRIRATKLLFFMLTYHPFLFASPRAFPHAFQLRCFS